MPCGSKFFRRPARADGFTQRTRRGKVCKGTYTNYNNEGWLTDYIIHYASEEETDLHCKNTFDAQWRLIGVDQYRLDDGSDHFKK
ncbi:hypothetical protein [Agriterribacter sp.]|uniref:hypothetical protein n=1 Tax=Agriterribacter sp. TaxID=2821509 RepID=UPI002CCA4748|nr:hypothetical protein [Agriterribacter sp.]HRO45535.1 hypothetical protein [Agriterribacter sp.]HRQ17943.1 hypothetical protein [Agriterribacter sp.]